MREVSFLRQLFMLESVPLGPSGAEFQLQFIRGHLKRVVSIPLFGMICKVRVVDDAHRLLSRRSFTLF